MGGCREGRLMRQLTDTVEYIRQTTAARCDPYRASILLPQPSGTTDLTRNKCTGSESKRTMKSNNSAVRLLPAGAKRKYKLPLTFSFSLY